MCKNTNVLEGPTELGDGPRGTARLYDCKAGNIRLRFGHLNSLEGQNNFFSIIYLTFKVSFS